MTEFEIRGNVYRSSKMTGLAQIHVLRRASPIIKPMMAAITEVIRTGNKIERSPKLIGDLIEGLSNLNDEALNYIFDQSLGTVEIKQDGARWAKIKSSNGLIFMFDHIRDDAMVILEICANVLIENYSPLFQEALVASSREGTPLARI